MAMRIIILCLGFIFTIYLIGAQLNASVFDVKTYGTVGDGKRLDTPAINKV